jgi:hypothetical protein
VAGVGVPVLLWALSELRVSVPKPALYALLGLSVLMIVGPWLLMGAQKLSERRKSRRMTTDERRAAERAEKAGGVPLGEGASAQGPASRGSFQISGKKLKNVHMRRNYSNHPESFGGISGEEIEDSTMEGNVHDPQGKGSARPIIDLSGADSIENVSIEDCSVEYTDGDNE